MICRTCRREFHRYFEHCPWCFGFKLRVDAGGELKQVRRRKPRKPKPRPESNPERIRLPRPRKAQRPRLEYREGARGHCYWCGRPEREHLSGGVCPFNI